MKINQTDKRSSLPTIPIYYLNEMLGGAKIKGLDLPNLLVELGLDSQLLTHTNSRVSVVLYSRVVALVREKLQDEFLGFLSKPTPTHAFLVCCQGITTCENLYQSIDYANHFYHMFMRDFSLALKDEGSNVRLSVYFSHQEFAHQFMISCLLLTGHKIMSWLIGEQIPIKEAGFSYQQSQHHSEHRYLFGSHILFEQECNYLVFDRAYFDCPTIRNYADASLFAEDAAPALLLPPKAKVFIRKVRQLIIPFVEKRLPDMSWVAQELNISQQHLWRKLHDEGTNYQEIKNTMRRDLAIHYLENPMLTVEMVAIKVGYQEERSFYKAFKKWTGITPGEYKRLVLCS